MLDRLRQVRDAWLGRPEVRGWLSRLPIGDRIAERHATRLFGAITGFAGAQMIAGALELGLIDRLAAAPLTVEALAEAGGLPLEGARALAAALEGAGLCARRGGDRIALTIDGLVVASDPGVRAMIAHHRLLYADLRDPVALLRRPGQGEIGAFWPYRGAGDPAGYSALMAASAGFAADLLASLHDFGRYARVVDVGGGTGALLERLAARWPRLSLALAELPEVAAAAAARLGGRGLARIDVVSRMDGDALPAGADAITLVRLLHDRNDADARALLARVAEALPPGGHAIVAEPMRAAGRNAIATYFAAYFLAMGSGRLRTPHEVAGLCRAAGLVPRPANRRHMLMTVITARKP